MDKDNINKLDPDENIVVRMGVRYTYMRKAHRSGKTGRVYHLMMMQRWYIA
ncbi:hypothetical protein LC724_16275 [Blautia sp. RD014234]|nr:hypothetical protein [Blautia parvula]